MKKFLFRNFTIVSVLTLIFILILGCKDNRSSIGGSVRPPDDMIHPIENDLNFSAQTIKIPSIYDRSTYSLLGEFTDPIYGSYRASYISRFQHAPGFKFAHTPLNSKIDSTFLLIAYSSWVGDSTIWNKATAYMVQQKLPDSRYSTDLTPFIENAKVIGSLAYTAGNKDGLHILKIPLDNTLGQKIYDASVNHPEYFGDLSTFETHVIPGIYVESTTGNGCILNVYSTGVSVQYKYEKKIKTSDGQRDSLVYNIGNETFVNTKQLYLHRKFKTGNIEKLLQPNENFAYITSPEGVVVRLTAKKSEIEKCFLHSDDPNNQSVRLINSAEITLSISNPENTETLLQPATYVLLLPIDSVKNFFEKGETELTQKEIAYLSSKYSVNERIYRFENISNLLNRHIENNIINNNGNISLEKDLDLIVLPVSRETTSQALYGIGTKQTSTLSNFLFPSAAKIKLSDNGKIICNTISTTYKRKSN